MNDIQFSRNVSHSERPDQRDSLGANVDREVLSMLSLSRISAIDSAEEALVYPLNVPNVKRPMAKVHIGMRLPSEFKLTR